MKAHNEKLEELIGWLQPHTGPLKYWKETKFELTEVLRFALRQLKFTLCSCHFQKNAASKDSARNSYPTSAHIVAAVSGFSAPQALIFGSWHLVVCAPRCTLC